MNHFYLLAHSILSFICCGFSFHLAAPCNRSPFIHMLMLRFALFLVLLVLPVRIICYTGDLHHLSPWYSFLNICRTKFARTEYLHIPFTFKDHIHGLWIFQQKMVSIHFPTYMGPNY